MPGGRFCTVEPCEGRWRCGHRKKQEAALGVVLDAVDANLKEVRQERPQRLSMLLELCLMMSSSWTTVRSAGRCVRRSASTESLTTAAVVKVARESVTIKLAYVRCQLNRDFFRLCLYVLKPSGVGYWQLAQPFWQRNSFAAVPMSTRIHISGPIALRSNRMLNYHSKSQC